MKTYNTLPEINSRIETINNALRYLNLDTDYAVNLQGELADLEIKQGLLEEQEKPKKLYTQEQKQDLLDFAAFARSCDYDRYNNGEWLYLYNKQLYTDEQLLYVWISENKIRK